MRSGGQTALKRSRPVGLDALTIGERTILDLHDKGCSRAFIARETGFQAETVRKTISLLDDPDNQDQRRHQKMMLNGSIKLFLRLKQVGFYA
jgi:hypothetical protein